MKKISLLLLGLFLKGFIYLHKRVREGETPREMRDREIFLFLLLFYFTNPTVAGLSQAETRIQDLHLGLIHGRQGTKALSHFLLLSHVHAGSWLSHGGAGSEVEQQVPL